MNSGNLTVTTKLKRERAKPNAEQYVDTDMEIHSVFMSKADLFSKFTFSNLIHLLIELQREHFITTYLNLLNSNSVTRLT